MTRTNQPGTQYFKSIEQVAANCGFNQVLPSLASTGKKRDSVIEKLDSPRSPKSNSFLPLPAKPEISRSVTPELIPDPMHDRLPESQNEGGLGLNGLVPGDLPIQRMGERV